MNLILYNYILVIICYIVERIMCELCSRMHWNTNIYRLNHHLRINAFAEMSLLYHN